MTPARSLGLLAAGAVISMGLAAFALHQRAHEGTPAFTPGPFFPGFAAKVKDAARIHVAGHDGAFDVVYAPDRGWYLPGHGKVPADFDEVRHTLISLAALQTLEPKTARPDWLHYVGLETPPKGTGTEITVSDAAGHVMASLIAGSSQEGAGGTTIFVRRPGEDQSWLVQAPFVPHGDIAAWMSLKLLELDPARLKDVTVTPAGTAPFTVTRVHPSDPHFILTPAVKNADPSAVDEVAEAVANLTALDVKDAAGMDFAKAGHVVAHSYDGLNLTLDLVPQGSDVWAKLTAGAAMDALLGVQKEMREINAKAEGRAYKLSPETAKVLTHAPPAAAPAPPMPVMQGMPGMAMP
jgi:hypothetical protein